ncbi:MAG TPA: lipoyl(octanoyl) transferase LipB [Mycobacteriales bacterium]
MRTRWLGRVAYDDALTVQRDLHAAVVAGTEPDTVLLLEHDSVYTAGRRTTADERPHDPTVPVVDVDRGGKITWHGPGQLVGYPIVRLPDPVDVVAYVHRVEQVMIDACADLDLAATRVAGRSGTWTTDGRRKIGAVGIRVSQGVTMHGFALNADPDLSAYDLIVACGIRDAGVTSIAAETGHPVSVDDVRARVEAHLDVLAGVPA